jgi:hypothetical protein
MSDPNRLPLDPYIYEQIEAELHAIDGVHWPLIAEMRVKNYHPLDIPIPPQKPKHLLQQIVWYAERLFKSEADHYEQFRKDGRYPAWLSRLADRIKTRVLNAVDRIEHGESILSVQISSLLYHGLSQPDIEKELQMTLWEITKQYEQGNVPPIAAEQAQPKAEPKQQDTISQALKSEPAARQRMSATVHSPSAARKMVEYMNAKGMNQTEFSIQAKTTDKTIRKFRQTGKIKGSILAGIASAMGISREQLLQ